MTEYEELEQVLEALSAQREELTTDVDALERELALKGEALKRMSGEIAAIEKALSIVRRSAHPGDPALTELEPTTTDGQAEVDFSRIPRKTAALGVLAGSDDAMHYKAVATIIGAPTNTAAPTLAGFRHERLAEVRSPGNYELARPLMPEHTRLATEALRALAAAVVEQQHENITAAVHKMEGQLPFAGFEEFRRHRLPNVLSLPWANEDLAQAIMQELVARDFVAVYHVKHPDHPDRETAALRCSTCRAAEMIVAPA